MGGIKLILKSTGQQMVAKLQIEDNTEYVYYTKEGEFLGGKEDSKKVFISSRKDYEVAKKNKEWNLLNNDDVLLYDVDNKTLVTHYMFIAFASMVWTESSGIKEESYAIANASINFLKSKKIKYLKCLEDIVMYENHFCYGAKQSHLDDFCKNERYKNNSKNVIRAIINALHPEIRIPFTNDYSMGADAWDGIDLVQSSRNNAHRTYKWSLDSKELLERYNKERNGGVDVSKFTYKEKDYEIKAMTIAGKTIFCKILTNRTEKKKNNNKFTIKF